MRLLLSLLIAAAAGATTGCRDRGAPVAEAGGVGFNLPGLPHVERGALRTRPAGREEAFLSFVASHVPGWVEACLGEAGSQTPAFGFETNEQGAPGGLKSEVGHSARERCLASHAAATSGDALPPRTTVTVQLALVASSAPVTGSRTSR